MAYVEESDYSRVISKLDLDALLDEAVVDYPGKTTIEVRLEAEKMAQSKINLFLSERFDMAAEFALEKGQGRDQTVLKCYLDFSVYFLHFTIEPRDIPKLRIKAYNECITSLEMIRDGNVKTGLTELPETFGSVFIEGNTKFISKAFTDSQLRDIDETT